MGRGEVAKGTEGREEGKDVKRRGSTGGMG